MITNLDLRLEYKRDTSLYPTTKEYWGRLKDEYGEWLEDQSASEKRLSYKRDTGNPALCWRDDESIYNQKYILWLEEVRCKVKNLLEADDIVSLIGHQR